MMSRAEYEGFGILVYYYSQRYRPVVELIPATGNDVNVLRLPRIYVDDRAGHRQWNSCADIGHNRWNGTGMGKVYVQ